MRFLAIFIFTGSLFLISSSLYAISIDRFGLEVHGFLDARYGQRIREDRNEKDQILGEVRFQTDIMEQMENMTLEVKADFLYDGVCDDRNLDLEGTRSPVDLREANISFSPFYFMDIKIGRQILTWGTGDLLFLNDLFPKDWKSFFIGREEQYLKSPSDAIFISLFPSFANIDIVYTPKFDPDRYVRGERISFWNPLFRRRTGRRNVLNAREPNRWFRDDEWAVRCSRNIRGWETALYGYYGYWKDPLGFDPVKRMSTFPRLISYGASIRGTAIKGIVNMEVSRYVSKQDEEGDDPLIPNSEIRFLAGYEKELAKDLTGRFQYYLEYMEDYDEYKRTLPPGVIAKDKDRHLFTARLTKLLMSQNLLLCLFVYYSPSDQDAYIRSLIKYKVTDALAIMFGSNIFEGKNKYTFFGQFEKNSNIYAAFRYNY